MKNIEKNLPKSQDTLPGFTQPSTEPQYFKNFDQVANYFGVHKQTIKNWSARGMPKMRRGLYDASQIKVWAIKQGLIDQGTSGYSSKIQKEKYLHEKAKRKQRELELAIKEGKYQKTEDSKKEIIFLAQTIRMNILVLPSKVAPVLEHQTAIEIQKKLEIAVDEILRHLSEIKDE